MARKTQSAVLVKSEWNNERKISEGEGENTVRLKKQRAEKKDRVTDLGTSWRLKISQLGLNGLRWQGQKYFSGNHQTHSETNIPGKQLSTKQSINTLPAGFIYSPRPAMKKLLICRAFSTKSVIQSNQLPGAGQTDTSWYPLKWIHSHIHIPPCQFHVLKCYTQV